jgi:hypothetical protein
MTKSQKEPPVTIELDWSDEPPAVYANGAQILNTHREFALVLTDFAAFPGRGGGAAGAPPKAKIVANVRMSPEIFFQIAAACASNWNQFVNQYGSPGQVQPKFKIINGGPMQLEGLEPPPRSG